MKKLIFSLFLALIFLPGSKNIYADGFNKVHTSDGVYVIAVGDGGRIFRSVNRGDTWAAYIEPSVNFKSVFTLGNDVWMTVDNGKIYKSSKSSTSLTPINTGVSTPVNSIYFINSTLGFICGDNGVVMISVDGGLTWSQSNTGIPAVKLNSINFKDALNGIVVGNGGVIYTTANGGTSWTLENGNTTRNLLDAEYYVDGLAVVGEYGTMLLKATGLSWYSVDMKIETDVRALSGTSLSNIHVCGGGGFIRNKYASPEFQNFEKNPMHANLVDIVYNYNTGFAVSSLNNAIIRTTNGGVSWELPAGASLTMTWQVKPGATGNCLGDNLCPHPSDRNSIFTNFSGRTYVSRNRGETWSQVGNPIPSGTTPHVFYVSPVDTNIWLCAIEAGTGDKIARTTDYGQTWNASITRNFSNYGEPLQIDQNNPSVFYFAPDNGGFYKSTDNGATFNEISNNYPFRSPCDLMVSYGDPNTIFLADGTTGSGLADLFKSTNGGINWSLKFTHGSSSEIPGMTNSQFEVNTGWFTNWPAGTIYKSINSGDTWDLNHTNSFSGWGIGVCDEDPNFIMSGSWSGGNTSFTTDGGITWSSITGLSGTGGEMDLIDRGYVIGVAGSNVFKLNFQYSVITSVSETNVSSIPENFNLSQNYPNPFNPTTKISYALPKSGNVTLKVYNQLGKEVSTLVNAFKNAGSYEINFDATGLTSGVYFYKLQSDGLDINKKMLLVK